MYQHKELKLFTLVMINVIAVMSLNSIPFIYTKYKKSFKTNSIQFIR